MPPPWKRNHKSKLKSVGGPQRQTTYEPPKQIFMSRQTSTVNQQPLYVEVQKKLDGYNEPILVKQVYVASPSIARYQVFFHMIYLKLDIMVIDQTNSKMYDFNKLEVPINEHQEVLLSEVIAHLKIQGVTCFDKSYISVYNKQESQDQSSFVQGSSIVPVYTFCGQDPLPSNFKIKVDLSQRLEIKVRSTKFTLLNQMLDEQNISTSNALDPKMFSRVKERKISEVIERVALWRRLYTGFYDENRKFVQMPLNEAANKVKIAKKTLDDYLLQVRCGKRYGFDFNKYKNERIGKLRSYVKDKKKFKNDTL